MSDFTVRSDNVDVEQIMRQIRARIREKRGVDYTEEEIRELANVKLEKFIDPKGVRSGLLEEYRRLNSAELAPPNFAFEEETIFETHRAPIRWLRALLRPFLKLLFNPNPLIKALQIQADLNTRNASVDMLHYELIHNLVLELTRTGIEVKSLKMRLESMASRLDFDERRARALEGVVQYRAGAVPPLQPPTGQEQGRRDQGRRDQGQRQQGPRDQGARYQGQRNQGQRDQGPRDQGPRDQGPRDQGPRDQGARDQGSRDRDQGSRDQGPREQTTREQPATDQASRDQPLNATRDVAAATEGTSPEGFHGNALDADGNERRARRRRRRGRRRPGDRPSFGEGSVTSTATSSTVASDDRGAGVEEPRSDVALEGSTTQLDAPGIEDRGSSPQQPLPSAAHESSEAPARPAPAPEPPSES